MAISIFSVVYNTNQTVFVSICAKNCSKALQKSFFRGKWVAINHQKCAAFAVLKKGRFFFRLWQMSATKKREKETLLKAKTTKKQKKKKKQRTFAFLCRKWEVLHHAKLWWPDTFIKGVWSFQVKLQGLSLKEQFLCDCKWFHKIFTSLKSLNVRLHNKVDKIKEPDTQIL